jgi:hypothetical protein
VFCDSSLVVKFLSSRHYFVKFIFAKVARAFQGGKKVPLTKPLQKTRQNLDSVSCINDVCLTIAFMEPIL